MIDLAAMRAYLAIPVTALSDADLTRMLEACRLDQAARCIVPEEGAEALDMALLRRVQREVAAKNLPLGMVGLDASEFGPARLPFLDSLVEEHERAYRKVVLA